MKLLPLLLALCLMIGCSKSSQTTSGEGEDSQEKLTAKSFEPSMEARQFFADPKCVVWNEGFPLDELKQFTSDLYAAGAPKVMFGDLSEIDEKKVSAWFVVELPKDKAAKDRCIAVWNKMFADSDFEYDPKSDQDYLDMMMD
jgi:hypothetical protein